MSIRVGLRHMARSAVYRPAIYDAYRKSHEIEGSTVGAQTDYQVKITVHYEARDWVKELDPLLVVGSPGDWDDTAVGKPSVLKVGATYYLYYYGRDGGDTCTGLATGTDGKNFTKIDTGIGGTSKVLNVGAGGSWDDWYVWGACVVYHNGTFYMFYTGRDVAGGKERIGVATSPDGINFTKDAGNPILSYGGVGWRQYHLCHPSVAWDAENNVWVMLVSGMANALAGNESIGRYYCSEAEFPDTWHEDVGNPVIPYNTQAGVDDRHAYLPTIYPSKVGGKWYVYYTSAIVYAGGGTLSRATTTSLYDGAFTKEPNNPVIVPVAGRWDDEENATPAIRYMLDGKYALYYTGKDLPGNGIGLASSESIDGLGAMYLGEVALDERCRTDFGDVRFSKADGVTQLDYWLEEKVDEDYAIFWVKVENIPADPDAATIYIYYGNADATTASNGETTFPVLFDDFENLDDWSIFAQSGTPTWEATTEDGFTVMRLYMNADGEYVFVKSDITANRDKRVRFRCKEKSFTAVAYHRYAFHQYAVPDTNYIRHEYRSGTDLYALRAAVGGVGADEDTYNVGHPSGWYVYETRDYGDDVDIYRDTTLILEHTEVDVQAAGYVQFENNQVGVGTSEFVVDWIFIGKFISPEPANGAWGSEEAVVWPF